MFSIPGKQSLVTTVFLLGLFGATVLTAHAQSCGVSSVAETVQLSYPPIAVAARVQGDVVGLVRFRLNGTVESLHIITGPLMLRGRAEEFFKGLRANSYTGPRECPEVIHFRWAGESQSPMTKFERLDLQSVRIAVQSSPPVMEYSAASR